MIDEEKIQIYTDGACSGNPGAGGWAAMLIYKGVVKKISGGETHTTNNRMELMAAIKALQEIKKPELGIRLYTDSMYLKNGITTWIHAWRKKSYRDVKNMDLWMELERISKPLNIEWLWVKAHAGNINNNTVDEMAREEAERHKYSAK